MELLVRLILLPPLLVAAFNGMMGLFAPGYRKQEWVLGGVALAAVALPFVVTCALFFGFEQPYVVRYFEWMAAGDLQIEFAYRIDQLSLLMTMIVTGVGSLIHLYSIGYMKGDPGFWRFFAYLNLFIFAMLNLVLAENLPVLFLGWEGVGLCSYLLIGFWYTDLKNSAAANKAFIVNRIGDFAFLLAMFVVFQTVTAAQPGPFGLDFTTLLAPDTLALFAGPTGFWVCLLLFIGATGKSAQIPLFVWLPDAMAGPTPVSALIHAATMVTSGLYLLARLSSLVLLAPGAMQIIAIVGALTAIMAATVAITQNDIKKVLAYSTVSQLGYMFFAAGVGAYFVAIFHVMTHAFFKACLFLGSGSVIHSMHHVEHELEHKGVIPGHHGPGSHDTPLDSEATNDPFQEGGAGAFEEDAKSRQAHPAPAHGYATLPYDGPFDAQDMRTMGGLGRYMPSTKWTFLIATLAIAGIPGLAGFFSKDEILYKAFEYGYDGHLVGYLVWVVGLVTALLTAVYMTRAYLLTFEGEPRWPDALDTHPHESPWTMTVPLWVLAGLSVVGGFLGVAPGHHRGARAAGVVDSPLARAGVRRSGRGAGPRGHALPRHRVDASGRRRPCRDCWRGLRLGRAPLRPARSRSRPRHPPAHGGPLPPRLPKVAVGRGVRRRPRQAGRGGLAQGARPVRQERHRRRGHGHGGVHPRGGLAAPPRADGRGADVRARDRRRRRRRGRAAPVHVSATPPSVFAWTTPPAVGGAGRVPRERGGAAPFPLCHPERSEGSRRGRLSRPSKVPTRTDLPARPSWIPASAGMTGVGGGARLDRAPRGVPPSPPAWLTGSSRSSCSSPPSPPRDPGDAERGRGPVDGPRLYRRHVRAVARAVDGVRPAVSTALAPQLATRVPWFGTIDISYYIGIDGLNLLLVLLTTLLGPIIVLSSWTYIGKAHKGTTRSCCSWRPACSACSSPSTSSCSTSSSS